ncbi:MAG: M13 family peptidase, partial [Halioglobus sp.]|nr:M13 family peptidase [Halioglobus sp.]
MQIRQCLVLSLLSLLASCTGTGPGKTASSITKPELGTFGIDTQQMDTGVKPGNDFFRYVNGTWLDNTEIPADKSRYGSFNILQEKTERDVHALLEDLGSEKQSDPTLEKVADLYAAWMDEATIEA